MGFQESMHSRMMWKLNLRVFARVFVLLLLSFMLILMSSRVMFLLNYEFRTGAYEGYGGLGWKRFKMS